MVMKWIIETYESRSTYPPLRLEEQFHSIQNDFQHKTGFCLGCEAPRGNPYDTVWSLGGLIAGEAVPYLGLGLGVLDIANKSDGTPASRADMYLRMSQAVQYQDSDLIEVAGKLDSLRQRNNVAAIAVERILGIPREQSARTIFETSAVMPGNPRIQELVSRIDANSQQQLVISPDELSALYEQELSALRGVGTESFNLIKQLATNQAEIYRYMTNAEQRAANQQMVAERQFQRQKEIDAANASIYILSTFVGFSDPERAHQMQVIGSSTVQIVDSLNKFAAADALTSIALSGNVLGAAMNVVSLFKRQGPSPDQQILRGIAEIKTMLNQIRGEMHTRFDRVDKSLNKIYETMTDRFNQINLTLGELQGDVDEIQRTLLDVQADVHRLERKVFAFLDAGFRRDLNEQINLVIGYRETFGQPIPWSTYLPAENKFFTWATANAKDELSSGSAGRGYDDSSLFTELNSQPTESNLNYLNQYLGIKFVSAGLPPFAEARLANPRDWALAANAYLELALEAPMFFRQIAAWRLDNIRSVGTEISTAIENITLASNGTNRPIANRALFNALLANYRAKGITFGQRIAEREAEIRQSTMIGPNSLDAVLAEMEHFEPILDTLTPADRQSLYRFQLIIFRRILYQNLLLEFNQPSDLQRAANELAGSKALFDGFINLGFSQSFESDDFIRSFLYGIDRVLDLESTKELYQRTIDGEFNASPKNGRVDFSAALDQRCNALQRWITNHLARIESDGRSESLRLVSATLDRIDAFRAAKLEPIPAPFLSPASTVGQGPTNVVFTLHGEPNVQYRVQYSENLLNWSDLLGVAENDKVFFDAVGHQRRFYRTLLIP